MPLGCLTLSIGAVEGGVSVQEGHCVSGGLREPPAWGLHPSTQQTLVGESQHPSSAYKHGGWSMLSGQGPPPYA